MDQVFELVDIKNILNLTKIGSATMGVPLQTGTPKFKLFNPIFTGLFLHFICTGGGGKFAPYLKTVWYVIEVKFFVCLNYFFLNF